MSNSQLILFGDAFFHSAGDAVMPFKRGRPGAAVGPSLRVESPRFHVTKAYPWAQALSGHPENAPDGNGQRPIGRNGQRASNETVFVWLRR